MGIDAVALSGRDLEAGEDFIRTTSENGFPWVSANLVAEDDKNVVPNYIIKESGNLSIAITAITDIPRNSTPFTLTDYNKALPSLLKTLSMEHDIVIVLSNLTRQENKQIANLFPEIDILISSDKLGGKMSPAVVGKTLMTQTSTQGKYLGMLDIHWSGGSFWRNDRLPQITVLQSRLEALSRSIEALSGDNNSSKQLSRLELQKSRLIKEIESRQEKENAGAGQSYNAHKINFLAVRPMTTPDDIEAIVQSIEMKTRQDSKKK
jgi:2',3'-cyclic-nucleotide 2'-phosphodiesterase (5'-nucleotidase family)